MPRSTRTLFATTVLLGGLCGSLAGCKKSQTLPSQRAATPPQYPSTARVIVDTSASMRGYFEGSTEFKNNVADLAASLDKLRTRQQGLQTLKYELIAERGSLEETDFDTPGFIEQMRSKRLMQHQDSLLQNAFKNSLESLGSSDVAILISDSIISYPDADIRANPRINIDNVASLGSEAETVFAQARARHQAVMVLASKSDFHGTYFDYANQKIACCTGKRPYYIWLLGKPEQIRAIADFLETEHLQIDHQITFGNDTYKPQTAVLQRFSRVGTFYRVPSDGNAIEVKSGAKGMPIIFGLALNFSKLPASMQESGFLREHLRVTSTTASVKVVRIQNRQEVQNLKDNDAVAILPEYTHVVTLSLDPNAASGAVMDVTVDSALPAWYLGWSNDDDSKTATAQEPTTFGLKYLIEGISRAYSSGEPVATTRITVRK
jgi:hypothetical protein